MITIYIAAHLFAFTSFSICNVYSHLGAETCMCNEIEIDSQNKPIESHWYWL